MKRALAHGLELRPYYVKVVNLIVFVRNIFPKFYKFKIDSAPYTHFFATLTAELFSISQFPMYTLV